jgi:hypothetical protein
MDSHSLKIFDFFFSNFEKLLFPQKIPHKIVSGHHSKVVRLLYEQYTSHPTNLGHHLSVVS